MNTSTPVSHRNFLGLCRPASLAGRFISKTSTGARLLAAAALAVWVAVLAPQSAAAATITWGPATTISGDADVTNSGTALYAYSGTAATVNGVSFTAVSNGTNWGSGSSSVSLSGFGSYAGNTFGYAGGTFSGLSTVYANVLTGGAYGGATAGTVTLTGLTIGHDYAVQIWVNDSRNSATTWVRTETINGSSVTLAYNAAQSAGGVGQYVVGVFAADNTNQSFAITPSASGSVQLNAICVRDNGSSIKTWLGTADASWGTAGNWSPAYVPILGDSVLFNSSSTFNRATMLDTSYTLATLTLSNAPAPVSIGNDGNTLTINSGINLLGTGQSLTNSDALVLGASQTWNVTNNGYLQVDTVGVSGSAALTITGNGTVDFQAPATYTGNTTINGGRLIVDNGGSISSPNILVATNCTLALSGSGSISGSPTLFMAGGATFDASAATSASFAGTVANTSSGAVLNGTITYSGGTPFSMLYDGANPPFIQTNGILTLSGGTININNTGAVLGVGNHTIIAAAQLGILGAVGGSLPSVNLTGNGAVGAVSLQIDGNNDLQLVVSTSGLDVWTGGSNTNWDNAGNWNTASVPNPLDWILFNNLSTANLGTDLGAQGFVPTGLTILNPPGPVSIGSVNGQTLEIGSGGINLHSASQDLTITAPLSVPNPAQWNIATNRNLNINGGATGGSGPTIVGSGSVNLNTPVTFQGTTTVASGSTLKMTTANVLSSVASSTLAVNGVLDLNGKTEAIDSLSGTGIVDNTGGGAATLTNNVGGDKTAFNGILRNIGGALALDVFGSTLVLGSTNNTYSGGTTFEPGAFLQNNAGGNVTSYTLGTGPVTFNPGSGTYTYGCTFTNALSLNDCYLRIGGNNDVQIWSGPVTVTNGFKMSGDNANCQLTLSGSMNIGTGGISITNTGNNGPNGGSGTSYYGDLLSGSISGSGGVTYELDGGNSRMTVQGNNSYTGGTIVNGTGNGKLSVAGGINPFSTGPVTLNAGAIIETLNNSATITNALTLNGGILESEPYYNSYNTLTWSGPITLTADSSLVQFAVGALNNNQSSGVNVSGPLNMGGFTLTCSSPVAAYNGNIISGPISGAGTILENGNNNLTVSGSNTFSGTFRSVLGNLSVQNAYALQNATLDMNSADSGSVGFSQNSIIGALTGTRNLANGGYTLTIGNNNATTIYSGTLSGSGGLTKIGTGTLTLSANAYTGNTTVSAGTLSLLQPTLALLSTVSVSNGAVLNLNFNATNAVVTLVLNGVTKASGVWNSANSGGLITGTGAIQVGAYPYIWSGALSSEWSTNNLGSPKNWTYFSNPINYADGSAVQFDNSSANPTVNISLANVMPAIVTFSNSINSYTIGGSFGIAGSSALFKNGSGSVTLTTSNTFTGPTIISAGTLTMSGTGTLGSSANYSGNITNNGTLNFNSSVGQTLSGIISGTGAINDADTGGMALNGANTFSGGFNLLPGAANIGSGTTVGGIGVQFGTGPVTISSATYGTFYGIYGVATQTYTNSLTANGTLLRVGGGGSHTLTWSGPITLSTNGVVMGGDGSAGAIILAGNITVSSPTSLISSMAGESFGGNVTGGISGTGSILTVSNLGAGLSLNGPISGSISVYSGAGTVVLGTTNTFSGTARSLAGTLQLNNALSLQNATLDMNAADSGAVTYSGITTATFGALTGSRNLALPSGAASIGNNNTTTAYTGLLSGNSLIKIGSGTLTLSSNAYTGNTTVSAGTLSIAQTNLAFSSIVTVASGAVLNLNYVGTNVVSELVLNGVIQPNGVYKSSTPGGYIAGSGAIQVGGIIPNVWTGAASGTWSTANIGTPFNWKSNSVAGNYTDGSAVLFDDTLLGNNVVILTNNVSPIAVTFNNNNTNYTIGGNSAIAGNCALIKNGAGTVTLTNNNTYTGSTVINSNTLTIGNAGKLGNGTYAGSILINTGATLEYNSISAQTLSGPITGAGRLIKDGATKVDLTLSSALNTYSGPTIITNGRVFVSVPGNIGGGTTIVQTNAGQLYISAATTLSNPMNISSIGYPEADAYGSNYDGAIRCDASSTLSGMITLSGNARLGNYNASGVTFTVSGQITGPYSIDFYGMNGATANNSRNFLLSNPGNNFTGNANIFCNDFSAARTGASTTLKLGASEVIPNGNGFGNVVFNGADANHLTILEMNGFNETINGVSNVSATGAIIRNTSTGASTLTIGDANSNSTFTGVITDGGAGKTLAITKIGSGTLTLSSANTYNGGTTINGGTLLINATTGTGTNAVTIKSGGTLGGTGSIIGLVTNNAGGILSPGVSGSGTLTLSGNLTLASGSTNTFAVNGSTPTNTSVALGAAVTYSGVLNIVPSGTFTAGQTFTLFSGAGATTSGNFASIVGSPGAGKTFSFTNGVLSVVGTGPSGSNHLTNSITGGGTTLSLSWGNGWTLQQQTNSLSIGLGTNWQTYVSGIAGITSTNISIDQTKPTVFYRLTYP